MSAPLNKFLLVRLLLAAALACVGLTVVSMAPAAATAPSLDPLECLSDQTKGASCAKRVDRLYQPIAIASSPDGTNVYVVTLGSLTSGSQLTTFDRNPSTGAVTLRATTSQKGTRLPLWRERRGRLARW